MGVVLKVSCGPGSCAGKVGAYEGRFWRLHTQLDYGQSQCAGVGMEET